MKYATGTLETNTLKLLPGIQSYDVITGVMVMDDGHVWRSKEVCHGHPRGTCNNRLAMPTDIYCYSCEQKYDAECARERMKEKSMSVTENCIAKGMIPADARHWNESSLYAGQYAAFCDINDGNQSVFLHGVPASNLLPVVKKVIGFELSHGRECGFVTAHTLIRSQKEWGIIGKYSSVNLLVIYDVDKGGFTDWNVPILHEVLSARHSKNLRTIMTSEKNGKHIVSMLSEATNREYGKSTLERMSFPGRACRHIEFNG
jgi:hypothetical protein